jgi:hypothetical protein
MDVRRLTAAVMVALVVSACSGEPSGVADATGPTPDASFKTKDEGTTRSAGQGGQKGSKAEGNDRAEGTKRSASGGGDGGEGSEDDNSSSYYPAAGIYAYAQSGYEEFCDASRCEREDLPPTQEVKTSYQQSAGASVTVVTEARGSDSRLTRTTTKHSRDQALITNVRVKFNYEGFEFDNSYQPDPPVEAIRFPLDNGMSWTGSWRDSTSGDYSIRVGPLEEVDVGGRAVQAFQVHTKTTFRGEFEGDADVRIWIDPATAATVKMSGELHLKSMFGSYNSEFSGTLRSGPGYR